MNKVNAQQVAFFILGSVSFYAAYKVVKSAYIRSEVREGLGEGIKGAEQALSGLKEDIGDFLPFGKSAGK